MNPLATLGRTGVRAIDLALKRYYHVFEFTDNPQCILRIALSVNAHEFVLSDGVQIRRGEPILELHFWNERLPVLPHRGASLEWGIEVAKRARHSLCLLAEYLACEPRFNSVHALHGESGFLEAGQLSEMRALVEHLGFDFVPGVEPGWRVWKYAFWQNLFSWWLMWTFNPASLHGKQFNNIARNELWMSRTTLTKKFGERATDLENWRK